MNDSLRHARSRPLPDVLHDVWSRPGRYAYRRAWIFLLVNLAVFVALNCFQYWLHNADWFDFSLESYRATFDKTLLDFLRFPIDVQEVPMMIVVLGLLMAITVIVPVLVSQLYGFGFALFFCAAVLVFGHLPALSVFLVVAAFIAGSEALRLPFRFGSVLMALFPIIIYFYVATRGTGEEQSLPVDLTPLYAPWVLALVAAAVTAAFVLAFAKWAKYRPGGILLSMIPFLAVPVVLFHAFVGRDELYFRLLEHRFGPASAVVFSPTDLRRAVLTSSLHYWEEHRIRDRELLIESALRLADETAADLLTRQQTQTIQACDNFLNAFPASRYRPNVLYLQGRAKDTRLDPEGLRFLEARFYHSYVTEQSQDTWQRLLDNAPDTIYATEAGYRLAVLAVRQEDIDRAQRLLADTLDRLRNYERDNQPAGDNPPVSLWEQLKRPTTFERPRIDTDDLYTRALSLADMIDNNRDDPDHGNAPLAMLMTLDPRGSEYPEKLQSLKALYAESKLADNLAVLRVLTLDNPSQRLYQLTQCAEQFAGTDGGAAAVFELARLKRTLGLAGTDPQRLAEAKQLFRRVVDEYPDSHLVPRARHELSRLENQSPLVVHRHSP